MVLNVELLSGSAEERMANSVSMFAFMKCTLDIIVGMKSKLCTNLHWSRACMPLGWPRKLFSKEEWKNQFWTSVNNILHTLWESALVGPTSSLKYADSAQITQREGKEMVLGTRM